MREDVTTGSIKELQLLRLTGRKSFRRLPEEIAILQHSHCHLRPLPGEDPGSVNCHQFLVETCKERAGKTL